MSATPENDSAAVIGALVEAIAAEVLKRPPAKLSASQLAEVTEVATDLHTVRPDARADHVPGMCVRWHERGMNRPMALRDVLSNWDADQLSRQCTEGGEVKHRTEVDLVAKARAVNREIECGRCGRFYVIRRTEIPTCCPWPTGGGGRCGWLPPMEPLAQPEPKYVGFREGLDIARSIANQYQDQPPTVDDVGTHVGDLAQRALIPLDDT